MNKQIVSIVVIVIVVSAGAFYGGMKYGQQRGGGAFAAQGGFRAGMGQGGQGGRRGPGGMGGGAVSGEILSKDDKSITVKLRDGGSKIVFFGDSTQVMKSIAGSPSDLTVGAQVMTFGTTNSDGSVTAQSVQIRPKTGN